MGTIKIDNSGYLWINGLKTGLITKMSVKGKMVFDSSKVEGSSGKENKFNGFDDETVTMSIILFGENHLASKKIINNAYKKVVNNDAVIYQVESERLKSYGIKTVLFIDRAFDEENEWETPGTLTFQEYRPTVAAVQEQQKRTFKTDFQQNVESDFNAAMETDFYRKKYTRS